LLINTDGTEFKFAAWTPDVIENGFAESRKNGLPLVGLVLRGALSPFPIPKTGKILFKVTVDGQDFIAANLNVIFANPSAPASEQRPSQSVRVPLRRV
jgi:hypothetical protein